MRFLSVLIVTKYEQLLAYSIPSYSSLSANGTYKLSEIKNFNKNRVGDREINQKLKKLKFVINQDLRRSKLECAQEK